ncbi:MAG: murein biosynthesis integral membrane protein MurJ [Gammaproteobacteria bacterium]
MFSGLLKSTLVVGVMTTLSRIFGLIRDVVMAAFFSAGGGLDTFIVAFRIPNFLRRIFAEGGFSQAFVPVLSEYRQQREGAEVQALLDQTAAVLGLALLLTTAIGVLAAPWLIYVFAPGFINEPDKQLLAGDMLRITFPYLLFISLTALAGGVLNTYGRFAVPAFTPVLLNLSLIGCALWLAPYFPESHKVMALAWGVLLAGIVQLLFQFPFLLRIGRLPRPGFKRDPEGVRRILTLMIPALFAASVTQINLLVDTIIASFLPSGSISWLYFSDRLVEFPLGVFGIALATVILPHLADKHSGADSAAFSKTLDWALRWVLLIAVPAGLGLILLAVPAISTLFQYNEFSVFYLQMSSYSLMAYALGLPGFILIKVLAAGFFARQDTATPVRAAAIAMVCNIILNLLLVIPLDHAGLALATSLAAYINAGILYVKLRRQGHYQHTPDWGLHLGRVALAALLMGLPLYLLVPGLAHWSALLFADRLLQLLWWIAVGAGVYLGVIWLAGHRGLKSAPEA